MVTTRPQPATNNARIIPAARTTGGDLTSKEPTVSELKYQIIDLVTNENEGIPYRYEGRCVERVRWLNATAGECRYSIEPVQVPL
jgi:hypothetical protein